ncbi:Paraplegin [Cichlidogyrus casuarinus]|uniref:Paraplegin n=1 Tax=Cichlidogyrus casuarinus TaxID=1844966 RepID=A0ABD2QAL1_9PLAT
MYVTGLMVFLIALALYMDRRSGPPPKLTKEQIERLKPRMPRARPGGYIPPYAKQDRVSSKPAPDTAPTNDDKIPSSKKGDAKPFPFSFDPFGEKEFEPTKTDLTFKDVVGLHASKAEVMEFVSYLKSPGKFQNLGAKLPKGALLLGPPGCGKTLLVKALSNEAGVPFYSMAGSEFVEVIGGLGAQRIRKLFKKAREDSPAIIFIDEIDSVGRRRITKANKNNSEMEQTLNQLLVEMDGMDTTSGVIVFAATNRADLLDSALLRAGRFDRHVYIDLPNLSERKELFNMYLKKIMLAKEVDFGNLVQHLANITPRMSGADVARLCNEAALITTRRNDYLEGVKEKDFEVAFERIIAGSEKSSNPLSVQERKVSAAQEAGRTLVAWFTPAAKVRPTKASILPRTFEGGTTLGGFTHLIEEDRYILTTEEIEAKMQILLAGRAAEQLIFNHVSDASAQYLKRATDLAYKQVKNWGMSQKVGNLSFEEPEMGVKPYSKATENMIEMEVTRLVAESFHKSIDLLRLHKNILDALIEALMEKDVLNKKELESILPNHIH